MKTFMLDPLYRAAAVCQAYVRGKIVRRTIASCEKLLPGAQSRYQVLGVLVSFEQHQLAAISQFLGHFLVPIHVYCKVSDGCVWLALLPLSL